MSDVPGLSPFVKKYGEYWIPPKSKAWLWISGIRKELGVGIDWFEIGIDGIIVGIDWFEIGIDGIVVGIDWFKIGIDEIVVGIDWFDCELVGIAAGIGSFAGDSVGTDDEEVRFVRLVDLRNVTIVGVKINVGEEWDDRDREEWRSRAQDRHCWTLIQCSDTILQNREDEKGLLRSFSSNFLLQWNRLYIDVS